MASEPDLLFLFFTPLTAVESTVRSGVIVERNVYGFCPKIFPTGSCCAKNEPVGRGIGFEMNVLECRELEIAVKSSVRSRGPLIDRDRV